MPEPAPPLDVLLVTSPGCHYCDVAHQLMERLAEETPIRLRTARLASDKGIALMARHRVPFPPILMVDGVFFGSGRISERRLRKHLVGLGRLRVEA